MVYLFLQLGHNHRSLEFTKHGRTYFQIGNAKKAGPLSGQEGKLVSRPYS